MGAASFFAINTKGHHMHTEFDDIESDDPYALDDAPDGYVYLTAPAYWASYFINGDASSLDDEEQAQADTWLKRENVEVIDIRRYASGDAVDPHFTWHMQIHAPEVDYSGGDAIEYLCRPL